VSLRLLFSVSNEFREQHADKKLESFFPLDERLGDRGVNDIMSSIARRSTSPLAKELRDAAIELRAALHETSRRQRYPLNSSVLPWYETYLLLFWRGREDAFANEPSPELRIRLPELAKNFESDSFEAWLRRKQRAALLHFAAKLGVKRLPLGGAGIVVSLADGSIRDFLEILGEIYDAYTKRHRLDKTDVRSLDRFAISRTQIGMEIQADGIYSASSGYLAGVSSRAQIEPDVVTRILEGLGYYTAALQSDPDDPSVLGRAERGIFTVRFEKIDSGYAGDLNPERQLSVWNILRQAEITGYVRTLALRFSGPETSDPNDFRKREIIFRLHLRFAPHFRFSYRGAYEGVSLNAEDLWFLCDRESPIDPGVWADRMAGRVKFSDRLQLALPLVSVDPDA
jgi:hypothetical protein